MCKLIIGCGYVGHRLARFWRKNEENVFVTSRNPRRVQALTEEGFSALQLDVTKAEQGALPEVDTVVFAVGHDRTSGQTIEEVYANGLRRVLDVTPASVRRFIYLSSTGVYGHSRGEWVDEQSICEPRRAGGRACLAAELCLQHHPTLGSRAIILRLAGIYGPQRLPQVSKLLKTEPLEAAADAYVNLIHVDDVVQIIAAAEQQLAPPALLCVSDGQPVMRRDFYGHLAELLGLAKPIFVTPPIDSARGARAIGSKRVINDRLTTTLDFQFRFPTYRDGLAAISKDVQA